MPNLLIRNLSEETIAALKARARRNNRSTQAEVAAILEREAKPAAEDFWAVADRLRASFEGRTFGDSAELIREDRESH